MALWYPLESPGAPKGRTKEVQNLSREIGQKEDKKREKYWLPEEIGGSDCTVPCRPREREWEEGKGQLLGCSGCGRETEGEEQGSAPVAIPREERVPPCMAQELG